MILVMQFYDRDNKRAKTVTKDDRLPVEGDVELKSNGQPISDNNPMPAVLKGSNIPEGEELPVREVGGSNEIVVCENLTISPGTTVRIDLHTLDNYKLLARTKKMRVYARASNVTQFKMYQSVRISSGSLSTAAVYLVGDNESSESVSNNTGGFLAPLETLPFLLRSEKVQESFFALINTEDEERTMTVILACQV